MQPLTKNALRPLPELSYSQSQEGHHQLVLNPEAAEAFLDIIYELVASRVANEHPSEVRPNNPLLILTPRSIGLRDNAHPFSSPEFALKIAFKDFDKAESIEMLRKWAVKFASTMQRHIPEKARSSHGN
jgi:hypothetical protein